ncbi:MAG: hypothetical protein ACI9OJ_000964 [Myxococcota bacterium]|jgi:hypothetical protein
MKHPLIVALVVVFLIAPTAAAYVLYVSPRNSEAPLRWFKKGAVLIFDTNPPQEIAQTVATEKTLAAFQVWSDLSCDGTLTSFPFTNGGSINGGVVGFDDAVGAPNENLVVWVSSSNAWRHGKGVVALTSLTYDVSNGEIVDADIEFNDAEFLFSASGDPQSNEMDLENAVAHEAGHFLGLDHSAKRLATMYAKAEPGETIKSDLLGDDMEGFCALYGPDAITIPDPTTSTSPTCAVSQRGPATAPTVLWVMMFGLGIALFRRAFGATSEGR